MTKLDASIEQCARIFADELHGNAWWELINEIEREEIRAAMNVACSELIATLTEERDRQYEANAGLIAEIARLNAPVSDEEWKARSFPVEDTLVAIRDDVNALIAARQSARNTRAPSPVPAPTKCKYGDPGCPCQDGDSCHYEDTATTKAMTPPVPAPEPVREKLIEALKGMRDLFDADKTAFYIAKADGGITNGDQTQIDNAFIQLDAALALAEESKCERDE